MQPYSDDDIDDAIARIADDIARRSVQLDFPGASMAAMVDQLRRMEAARRGGDSAAAALFALTAQPAFETYRPTNATSRSRAILGEVVADAIAKIETPPP